MEHTIRIPQQDEIDQANAFLFETLNLAEQMLQCGAEVHRVEDAVERLCSAYGAERVEVFTITSLIIVTMYAGHFGAVTQSRHIRSSSLDLHRLELLNQLSREVCQEGLTAEQMDAALAQIAHTHQYGLAAQCAIYAMGSASFSLFFGAGPRDAAVAAVVGVLLRLMSALLSPLISNQFMLALLFSCSGGLLAEGFVLLGLGQSVELISIGNIMLLIPGIPLTNAIRDLFTGDTISGYSRFLEALLLAMTIAFGFALTAGLL